ncbi:MAG TPA: hypothetical protein VMF32_20035 [Xanthobacteraceae bacterium]|nr:hypothetical protein [Xanthobacteraceae bacterium]
MGRFDRAANLQMRPDRTRDTFRYGVAVLIGLTAAEEEDILSRLNARLVRPIKPIEEETALIELF